MKLGYSTGSISLGNFREAIDILKNTNSNCIELSALRENEIIELINSIDDLDLSHFEYISFHAPSKLINLSEETLILLLNKVLGKKWHIIVHPDIIINPESWQHFGEYLCIENMDKRKPIGRTCSELEQLFSLLPNASFCFDLAHARQIDPYLVESFLMAKKFSHRLVQLHISDVNSECKHEPLNLEAILSYRKVANFLPKNTPIIIESPVDKDRVQLEIDKTLLIFDDNEFGKFVNHLDSSINLLRSIDTLSSELV